MPEPVVAIFDIGKTNKKLFLFNESYRIVFEKSANFEETTDDDGDPCEDLKNLQSFVQDGLKEVLEMEDFRVRAINCTSYGASFVNIDENGKTVGYLYNYLKPYPPDLLKQFYETYGGEKLFSFQTASPVLGSLNSGMQLYRLKHEKPDVFNRIRYALHLPQYLTYLITGKAYSEITSIGCHTNLWHFQNADYHYWVKREGVAEKFPDLAPSDMVVHLNSSRFSVGIGLHDSSSALIPYLVCFREPFVLLSTGTWAISLNPFNTSPLTKEELECDCLCYLQYKGSPVKSSRLFAGHFHDEQVKRIAEHFGQDKEKYFTLGFNPDVVAKLDTSVDVHAKPKAILSHLQFSERDLSAFKTDEEAYYQLIFDLAVLQRASTKLVIHGNNVRNIFVDGGFGSNEIFMNLLAAFFPDMNVFASSIPQATAIGAAMAIHEAWNAEEIPNDLIALKPYKPKFTLPVI